MGGMEVVVVYWEGGGQMITRRGSLNVIDAIRIAHGIY